MTNDPLKDKRDPTRHKWRPWDEMRRLHEERRHYRADTIIRVIGGVILLAIGAAVLVAVVHFLSRILPRMF